MRDPFIAYRGYSGYGDLLPDGGVALTPFSIHDVTDRPDWIAEAASAGVGAPETGALAGTVGAASASLRPFKNSRNSQPSSPGRANEGFGSRLPATDMLALTL